MKIMLDEMTWHEIEQVQKQPVVVLVPTGSMEQHGLHLPVNVDARCATYISQQAAIKADERKVRALVAPTIHYTNMPDFRDFPGTIGPPADTVMALFEGIARSFIQNGFKNIIFVNGHYPNTALLATALRTVSLDFPKAGLYALSWWDLGSSVVQAERKSSCMYHAAELETSISLVIQPENVHMEFAKKDVPTFSLSSKWVFPDFFAPQKLFYHSRAKFPSRARGSPGVMGDATVASQESGEKFLSAIINDLVEILAEIVGSEGIVE